MTGLQDMKACEEVIGRVSGVSSTYIWMGVMDNNGHILILRELNFVQPLFVVIHSHILRYINHHMKPQ